jgi:nucleotide-binding universal stress UspA family protein
MTSPLSRPTVLLCTDGSEVALSALREGLAVLAPAKRIIVLTVAPPVDPTLVTGTGFAGGVMSLEEKDELVEAQRAQALSTLDETVASLGLAVRPDTDAATIETVVEFGDPGRTICDVAAALPADVVVIGTHGHSGIRRAIMGSTSDHVIRHAACAVLVRGAGG